MIRIFDIATGEMIRDTPPQVPMFTVIVKDCSCECGHYSELVRPEDLDAFCESHDVQDVWPTTIEDRDWVREHHEAFERIWRTSCMMPPAEDLKLVAWAKALPPERAGEIDPEAGSWGRTREKLHEIRAGKKNEYLVMQRARERPTP